MVSHRDWRYRADTLRWTYQGGMTQANIEDKLDYIIKMLEVLVEETAIYLEERAADE